MNILPLDAFLWRLIAFSRRRRLGVIGFWAVMAVLSAWLVAAKLSINTDSSDMISPDAPYRVAAAELKAAFPGLDEQVLVMVRADTADEADAFAESLAERLRGRDEVASLFAPASAPFFRQNGLLFLEVTELEDLLTKLTNAAPLIERLGPDPKLATLFDALAEASEQDGMTADQETLDALYRSLAGVFTSEDEVLSWMTLLSAGDAPEKKVLFTLDPVLDYTRLKPAQAVKSAILEEARAVRRASDLEAEVLITGEPVLRTEELETVSAGIGWALALSAVMVAVLLYLAFRSLRLVGACLAAISASVVLTAGVAVGLFGELNLISIAFAVLMVGLGADFSIHLLMHMQDQRARRISERAAAYRTVRTMGTALALTAPTTALAFFSFAPTAFIGMNQLGVIAGVGVLLAFLIAMTLIPALTRVPPGPGGRTERIGEGFARIARPAGLIVGGLGVLSIFMLPLARFDADPMALRAKDAPSVIAFNLVAEDEEATPYRLSVLAGSEERLLERAERLKAPSTVSGVRHLLTFVPEDQGLKLDLIDATAVGLGFALLSGGDLDPELSDALPRLKAALEKETSNEAARLLGALEARSAGELEAASPRVFRFWPRQREALAAQLQAGFVGRADIPQALAGRYVNEDGTYRLEVVPEGGALEVAERRAFVGDVLAIAPDAAGSARTALAAGDVIGRAMVQASVTAGILVAALLFAVTRSLRVLVILLVPLLLAGSLTTATGTLLGLPYNFANVLVLPLIIGIGIDSGIHLAFRAEATGRPLDAVRGPTGRAVFFSALTTIASFGSLVVSEHRGTASMGALLTIGMVWTLAAMLFVLPPLAERLYTRRTEQAPGNQA